jgi:hypothetical protein
MKPKEFQKIMKDFVEEQEFWESLNVGDVIYDEQPAGIEFDYFKMIIESINIEERYVVAHDDEYPDRIRTLTSFITQEMFEHL